MKIKGSKIRTTVDIKYLGKPVLVEEDLTIESNIDQYIYRVSCNNISCILKRYEVPLIAGYDTDASLFMEALKRMERIYDEYYLMKAVSSYSQYFAKPLLLNYTFEVKDVENKYLHIDILYEYPGIALESYYDAKQVKDNGKKKRPKDIFNFMRQSINALVILSNIGTINYAINPFSMVYDEERDRLKLVGINNDYDNKADNLFNMISSVGVFTWAMNFNSLIFNNKRKKRDFATYVAAISFYARYFENAKEEAIEEFIKKLINNIFIKGAGKLSAKEIVSEMKKVEAIEHIVKHTRLELNASKNFTKVLLLTNEHKEELKGGVANKNGEDDSISICASCSKYIQIKAELICGHVICKDCLIKSALESF